MRRPHSTRSDARLLSIVHGDQKAEDQQVGAHIGFELSGSLVRSPDIFPRAAATATEFERRPLVLSRHLLKSRQARDSRAEFNVALAGPPASQQKPAFK